MSAGAGGGGAAGWPLILALGLIAALAPLAVDAYLPAFPTLRRELGTTAAEVQLTLSGYMLGFALGQLVYGPLSDRFGRKRVLMSGIALFIVMSAACALSPGISSLVLFRFIQALGGAAGAVLTRAIVRDLHDGPEMARVMSLMLTVILFAPLVGPVLGGHLLVWIGWRAIFWALAALGVAGLLIAALGVPETLPPGRRAAPGVAASARGYALVLSHRGALGYILSGGVTFGALFAFLSGAPAVFIEHYGVAPQHLGYVFMINVTGVMCGGWINARLVTVRGVHRMMVASTLLLLAGAGAMFALTGLDLLGFWGAIAGIVAFTLPLNMINANAAAGAMEHFPHIAGTASAVVGGVRYGCGALAGLCVGLLHDGTALPMAAVVLGCAVLSVLFLATMVRGGAPAAGPGDGPGA